MLNEIKIAAGEEINFYFNFFYIKVSYMGVAFDMFWCLVQCIESEDDHREELSAATVPYLSQLNILKSFKIFKIDKKLPWTNVNVAMLNESNHPRWHRYKISE